MGLKESRLFDQNYDELSTLTKFSKAEIRKWHRGFQRTCPTGRMEKSEFISVFTELFPNGDASEFSSHIFDTFDLNVNGSLEFNEFIQVLQKDPDLSFSGFGNRFK